ncbi:hypothetical protein [Sphingomonas sp. BK069]|uniref:hypothetical protein n=1 Tax=Sphingomonas sp. BK069 TaxID=2586979 RepID=UPI0016085284|nr:hypothetical protein [Sphingomonas sp. BK069]MBB3347331.1 hypothetical protein [Sphingomonas sp. BK069]
MISIIELVSEEGAVIYLNPLHVVSVSTVPDLDAPLSDVTLVGDACWRVKGGCRDVAAHIFGEVMGENGRRYARVVRVGEAVAYEEALAEPQKGETVIKYRSAFGGVEREYRV